MNKNLKDLIVNYTSKLKDENANLKKQLEDYDRIKEELDDITEFIKKYFCVDDIIKLNLKETGTFEDRISSNLADEFCSTGTFKDRISSNLADEFCSNRANEQISSGTLYPTILKEQRNTKIHKSKKFFDKKRLKNSMVLFKKNDPSPAESEINSDIDLTLQVVENSFNLPIKLSPPTITIHKEQSSLDTIKNLFKNDITPIKKK